MKDINTLKNKDNDIGNNEFNVTMSQEKLLLSLEWRISYLFTCCSSIQFHRSYKGL